MSRIRFSLSQLYDKSTVAYIIIWCTSGTRKYHFQNLLKCKFRHVACSPPSIFPEWLHSSKDPAIPCTKWAENYQKNQGKKQSQYTWSNIEEQSHFLWHSYMINLKIKCFCVCSAVTPMRKKYNTLPQDLFPWENISKPPSILLGFIRNTKSFISVKNDIKKINKTSNLLYSVSVTNFNNSTRQWTEIWKWKHEYNTVYINCFLFVHPCKNRVHL